MRTGDVRRRSVVALASVISLCAITSASAGIRETASSRPELSAGGIGSIEFGLSQTRAVAALSTLFGKPAGHGINTGCGSRYTEFAWGDLAVEFRAHRFSGYRYIRGGYPIRTTGLPPPLSVHGVTPSLATKTGITLGSTLGRVHSAYPSLKKVGTDKWRNSEGLIFVDNASHDPPPASSRIIEIKVGTCGDF